MEKEDLSSSMIFGWSLILWIFFLFVDYGISIPEFS